MSSSTKHHPNIASTTRGVIAAIVGKPNVGKSTLLNHLCGGKRSIVSNRHQTTRALVRAVTNLDNTQMIFLDTPGWQTRHPTVVNRHLNRAVERIVQDTDCVIFMTAAPWNDTDSALLTRLPAATPIIGVINKVDLLPDRNRALPQLHELSQQANFAELIALSARRNRGVSDLKNILRQYAKPSPPLFLETPDDRDFFFAELARESAFRHLSDELPYAIGVTATSQQADNLIRVAVTFYAEKESQKRIIIGAGGAMLKKIAQQTRINIEKIRRQKVFLTIVVKVLPWQTTPHLLKKMRITA